MNHPHAWHSTASHAGKLYVMGGNEHPNAFEVLEGDKWTAPEFILRPGCIYFAKLLPYKDQLLAVGGKTVTI